LISLFCSLAGSANSRDPGFSKRVIKSKIKIVSNGHPRIFALLHFRSSLDDRHRDASARNAFVFARTKGKRALIQKWPRRCLTRAVRPGRGATFQANRILTFEWRLTDRKLSNPVPIIDPLTVLLGGVFEVRFRKRYLDL
jgi:hypothetical protein